MPQGVAIIVGDSASADNDLLAATSVEVIEQLGQPARFALRFGISPAEGDLSWLSDERLSPGSTLRIQVPAPDGEVCLIKGPVTGQQIRLVSGGSGSTVEVLGADESAAMDRASKAEVYAESSASDVVTSLLSAYGLAADVESSSGRYTATGPSLVQRGTDLAFVQRLARQNGRTFWLDCDATSGASTGHWRRLDLGGSGELELVINQEDENLSLLDIRWDAERPTSAEAAQVDPKSLEILENPVSVSPSYALGRDSLQATTGDTRSLRITAPVPDGAELTARAESALLEAELFVHAAGETTAAALGGVLRAHELVDLRGAGERHSGTWLITSVRHTIDSGGHRMSFELGRNGWGA